MCLCVHACVWTDASGSLYPQLSEFMGLNLSIEAIKTFSTMPEQSSGVSLFCLYGHVCIYVRGSMCCQLMQNM